MDRTNIVLFFGGCSSEYGVSLQSAAAVMEGVDRRRWQLIPVGITRQGAWFYYPGDAQGVRQDRWLGEGCVPALLCPDRGRGELMLLESGGFRRLRVDAAFPVLHGRNGEDGSIQGLIQMAGIPLAGCGVLSSALCMDKDRAHRMAAQWGVPSPLGMVVTGNTPLDRARRFANQVGYPLFVKPVKAGSSYGITQVEEPEGLEDAIALALEYDREAILEQKVPGVEVGCAVVGKAELLTGEVDQVELTQGFFDFEEKYTLKTSAIRVPAPIAPDKAAQIKQTAKTLYRALDCSGFARVDMFLTPQGQVLFNEVNTIPGFTPHSRFPGMLRAAGYSFAQVLDMILEQAVSGT